MPGIKMNAPEGNKIQNVFDRIEAFAVNLMVLSIKLAKITAGMPVTGPFV